MADKKPTNMIVKLSLDIVVDSNDCASMAYEWNTRITWKIKWTHSIFQTILKLRSMHTGWTVGVKNIKK